MFDPILSCLAWFELICDLLWPATLHAHVGEDLTQGLVSMSSFLDVLDGNRECLYLANVENADSSSRWCLKDHWHCCECGWTCT